MTLMLLRMVLVTILLLFGQHIALCSDGELDMYMKEIQKRRDAIVDAAASGVLTGDFEAEVPEV